jgi:hypothetical protein
MSKQLLPSWYMQLVYYQASLAWLKEDVAPRRLPTLETGVEEIV